MKKLYGIINSSSGTEVTYRSRKKNWRSHLTVCNLWKTKTEIHGKVQDVKLTLKGSEDLRMDSKKNMRSRWDNLPFTEYLKG